MSVNNYPRKPKRMTSFQMACLVALWGFLVYIVLLKNSRIDGLLVFMIIVSAVLVGLPIYRELKRRREEGK